MTVLTCPWTRCRCLDAVPERFANVTKDDVPNSFKYYSDFFSMLEEVSSYFDTCLSI